LAIEASRLARNGRDWHTLLEFCAFVNSLIIDEDGIYDPRLVNDRLLLGMKGTFSELELSILRQRSQEALRLKAARGDLHTTVAIGYRWGADDRLEQDPDLRVREALSLVFRKFGEVGSVRQLALWLRQERIDLPIVAYGPQGRIVQWGPPRYNTIHRLLTNPVYGGAYVFGRTGSRVRFEEGRKVITRGVHRQRDEWEVLIRDHHEGYISWEEYERNQRTIAGNANMKGAMVPGSVRNGGGVLVGLLRCGHCGRKLKVQHNGLRGVARYVCNDVDVNHATRRKCIAFGNMRVDAAVSAEVLRVISPLALEAAFQMLADRERAGAERLRQSELALEQARYEATRARRQYDAVDPDNRLVAASLKVGEMNVSRGSRGLKRRSAVSAPISRPPSPMTSAWCSWRLDGERAERRKLILHEAASPAGRQQDDHRSLNPGWAAAVKTGLHRRALCYPRGCPRPSSGATRDREWPCSITRRATRNSVFPIRWRVSALCHQPRWARTKSDCRACRSTRCW
jgi:hypothetical protein